jgi:hypothetical protein
MSKLTVIGENLDLARKVQVDIVTSADPNPASLLFARQCIQKHADLTEAFSAGAVDRELLGNALASYFPEEEAFRIDQVVKYLADEHEQIGGNGGIFLLNPTTGHAIARLSPEDFYVPAPVPREDGSIAKRDPQVKPEILALISQHQHDKGRDDILRETMLSRIPNRGFLPEVDKRQTLFVTGKGRKQVAAIIHDRLGGLIDGASGITKSLFDLFPRVLEPPSHDTWECPFEWTSVVKVGVQDPTTQNLKFDLVEGATASITANWARGLGADLLFQARLMEAPVANEKDLTQEGLYLCAPETSKRIPGRTLVAGFMEGFCLYLPSQAVGNLYLKDYGTEYREFHGKWLLKCTVEGTLYVDWSRIRALKVEGVDTDPSVELV